MNHATRTISRLKGFARKHQLLIQTITGTVRSSGRWPAYLKQGGFIDSLIQEGVSKAMPLLRRNDADLVAGAKSIARQLIHREKHERRWYETDPKTGRRVRKSEATMRLQHPVLRTDEDGASEWVSPLDSVECDADGRLVGVAPQNYNQVEAALLDQIESSIKMARVIEAIGLPAWEFCLAHTERKHSGVPIPRADRNRFQTLRQKVLRAIPANGS